MPTSHPSGWAHADGALRGPAWLREPSDTNELVTSLWSQTAAKSDGVLSVGGVSLPDLVREHGSPAYVLDEVDFRARARAFRDAFSAYDVYYAGKAFLCTTVARWLAEEGLSLDVCSGGELLVAERAGFPMERIGFHGNNKSLGELERAVELGVGPDHRRLLRRDRAAHRVSSGELGRTTGVMVRVTAGVEAHTHEYIATAHEDQKFGFSIASGDALRAVRRVHDAPGLRLLGLHSHIGSQIFDTSGFEVAARRVLALHASGQRGDRGRDARDGPRRRLRHRLHDPGRPVGPRAARHRDEQDRRARVPRPGRRRAAPVDRAGPRHRRSRHVHGLRRRHRQAGRPRRRAECGPTSRSTVG